MVTSFLFTYDIVQDSCIPFALGLHDITFFTPRYIITHDATILLNIVQKVAIQLGKGRGKAKYN